MQTVTLSDALFTGTQQKVLGLLYGKLSVAHLDIQFPPSMQDQEA